MRPLSRITRASAVRIRHTGALRCGRQSGNSAKDVGVSRVGCGGRRKEKYYVEDVRRDFRCRSVGGSGCCSGAAGRRADHRRLQASGRRQGDDCPRRQLQGAVDDLGRARSPGSVDQRHDHDAGASKGVRRPSGADARGGPQIRRRGSKKPSQTGKRPPTPISRRKTCRPAAVGASLAPIAATIHSGSTPAATP